MDGEEQKRTLLKKAPEELDLEKSAGYAFSKHREKSHLVTTKKTYRGTLFVIWSLSSAILVVTYGFRRRWSETLDGCSLFRFGVGLAHEVQQGSELSSTGGIDKCTKLKELPGLIGDSRPDSDIGRITLVPKKNWPRKTKMYC
ncbi:hypothetical protein ACJ73_05793 [Blastomyces percursus]|uniref:Uncharacterized protein n=1 Tax=Blastomyces percursus TaxID=1658174 RepID=A0A1J9Q447_9EURO|nr:hypothetical protein ACJ73_05793 [Blastomyces percursus]